MIDEGCKREPFLTIDSIKPAFFSAMSKAADLNFQQERQKRMQR